MITLALGIGANTAIFSVVRGVLLKPLPHRDGDRLRLPAPLDRRTRAARTSPSPFPRSATSATARQSLGGIAEYSPWTLDAAGRRRRRRASTSGLVTGNYFEVMGLSPVLGRLTRPSDDGPGVPPVMVLTHEFWMKRFGGDPSIVGKQVQLDGKSVTVIGVLQPAPFFPGPRGRAAQHGDQPAPPERDDGRGPHPSHDRDGRAARARRHARAGADRGRRGLRPDAERISRTRTIPASHYRVAVIPFKEVLGERARLTLWLLMGAAAFVMIISAANVANLTLMRGVRREHELVVRAALGAGRGAAAAAAAGRESRADARGRRASACVIAIGGVRLLMSLAARYSPRANEIRLDGVVLGFTLALVGRDRAAALVRWRRCRKEGQLRALDLGRRAPDERQR